MNDNQYSDYKDNDDNSRDWRDAINREQILERRVKELEEAVARLERDLRTRKLSDLPITNKSLDELRERQLMNIGAVNGTINNLTRTEATRRSSSTLAVAPLEPYKAD